MSNTCKDTNDVNSLYITENASKTIIIEYNPYNNWGRWNHNPSRIQNIIKLLQELGYNVQLKHIETEDFNSEGNIKIIDDEKKIQNVYEKFQSNCNKNADYQEKILSMIKSSLL